MRTKEQIEAEMAPLQDELSALRDAEERAETEKLLGRCFKYQNCYSCPQGPQDYWWMYAKVCALGDYHAKAFMFQTDVDGKVSIETTEWFNPHNGYIEISSEEFNHEWRRLQDAIANSQP